MIRIIACLMIIALTLALTAAADGARSSGGISIARLGDDPTVAYAADELVRYLALVTGKDVTLHRQELCYPDDGIRVGLMASLQIKAPRVADPKWDDAIYVDVKNGRGCIAGNNPRSVLIAVYRYLREQGCRWVRPGSDGEYIPRKAILSPVMVVETPSYRHRGVCLEGAVSYEHVRDMVDWLPKNGFNAYFTQFRESYTHYNRWYAHQKNPLMESKPITVEQVRVYTEMVVHETKKRGLIYHAVGHGWTCEPLGIRGLGWMAFEGELPEDVRQYFAQLNGKRDFYYWPISTNLCYSNPKVRELVTDEIVKYAQAHPLIDLLHFWLADGDNNQCECENCQKMRPADWYVMMLNELDKKLTAKGVPTRIVFLAYVDLLWPPEKEKIRNQDRFVLMFAPINRTYSETFTAFTDEPQLPPYVRNKLQFPADVKWHVMFLKAWQKAFSGDSFDFDYHLIFDTISDPGDTALARTISTDVKGLKDIGLDGFMSCQMQRVFYPTGLPMTVMGWTLWNRDAKLNDIEADYFKAAFGQDGPACAVYLRTLSELFDPVYMRGTSQYPLPGKPVVDPQAAERLAKVADVVEAFLPVIDRNLKSRNPCRTKSWYYMKSHAQFCKLLASAYQVRATGDTSAAYARWELFKQYVREQEPVIHPVFELYTYFDQVEGRLRFVKPTQ